MKSNKTIYWMLAILSLAGYAWIGFHMLSSYVHEKSFTVCLFKNVTGVACPSCGITRSLPILMRGHVEQSLMINPLGMIAALALLIIPVWILTDVITRKNTLAQIFLKIEHKIKSQKAIFIPLVALVLLNWGWNILKDL